MSGAASEAAAAAATESAGEASGETPAIKPFIESDHAETALTYNTTSRVPVIVMVIWAVLLISYVAYTVTFLLPDLMLWLRS